MTIEDFLRGELEDPESGFSIGVNGAIAEFFRDASEPGAQFVDGVCTVCTPRGALRLRFPGDVRPVAVETPSRHPDHWQQRVAFCLEPGRAALSGRKTIAPLGRDDDALHPSGRDLDWFDLGLGIPHVDVCVRTGDTELIRLLHARRGRDLLREAREVVDAIIEQSPERVFVSRLGRIEVYTPIPVDETVTGPHTHLLPELLGKADAAGRFFPRGLVSCFDVYPASPTRSGTGAARAFDARRHARFQRALSVWGDPRFVEEKRRFAAWLGDGVLPQSGVPAADDLARTARRVALRQFAATAPGGAVLAAWRECLEGADRPRDAPARKAR
ncbi:MAG: hypothetical protein R3174_02485 [Gammaproteobacteria bacterium]|nr:hypothetical protein [Gammaproteobacteria bacterium]